MGIKKKWVPGCSCCGGGGCCNGSVPSSFEVTISGIVNQRCASGFCGLWNDTFAVPYWRTVTVGSVVTCQWADTFNFDIESDTDCSTYITITVSIAYDSSTDESTIQVQVGTYIEFVANGGYEEWAETGIDGQVTCSGLSSHAVAYSSNSWSGGYQPCNVISSSVTITAA